MPVNATGRFQSYILPTLLLLLLQMVAPLFGRSLPRVIAAPPTPPPKTETAARIAKKLNARPMTFEENQGQTQPRVKFTARGKGYGLFLTPTEAVMTLQQAGSKRPLALRMQLAGGNPNPVVTGRENRHGQQLLSRQ
jgi:hypothetical protein